MIATPETRKGVFTPADAHFHGATTPPIIAFSSLHLHRLLQML